MLPTRQRTLPVVLLALFAATLPARAAEIAEQDAWKALPAYQYGQDMAPLLAIDRAVIRSMASPDERARCAARLAAVLEDPAATHAARQYACLQLRQAGTPAQVPVLARLVKESDVAQPARYALEAIPGDESLAALRDALSAAKGQDLLGLIHSLAARKDARSVPVLVELADAKDVEVASAALGALGHIADQKAAAFLIGRAAEAGVPTPPALAVSLLRCAAAMAAKGDADGAKAVYTLASQEGQAQGVRRAGLEGLLRLEAEKAPQTIAVWLANADPQRQLIAAGHLKELSDVQLDALQARLGELPESAALTLLQVLASRKAGDVLPLVMAAARSDRPELRLAGIRGLAVVGDASAIPILLDALGEGGELAESASAALARLPRKDVGPALLDALASRPEIRLPVIDVLARLKYYEAIDLLIEIAAKEDPAVYGPALDGLRGIADPDKTDTPRLVRLLLRVDRGQHSDEVEKTILLVCQKQPAGSDPAGPVLDALAMIGTAELPKVLPLLGRLGGPKSLAAIEAALKSPDPAVQEAAVRGLANWPDASVAGQLLKVATDSEKESYRRWALRAYVRVVTLPSDRPEAETLSMLQAAMKLAAADEDRQLVIDRASTVRTMECVRWLAPYLDDPALAQSACRSLVELAHQRFLRHPNMETFAPLLDKIAEISTDPEIVQRAKRYRLGL
jgi:HEAT repeat protein